MWPAPGSSEPPPKAAVASPETLDLCKLLSYIVVMKHTTCRWALVLCGLTVLGTGAAACGSDDVGADVAAHTEIPAEGTCEATGMVAVANDASFEALDVDAALDRRAAENIVAARPIETLAELDAVAYVGPSALGKIFDYAETEGYLASCAGQELGILSDLDKTVVPPSDPDLSLPPYPGVATLYQILEHRSGGLAGDAYYVTARQPGMVTEIPAYLEEHDVPAGPIETGISGLPWVAEPEKVADVSAILEGTGTQPFVLFGDSSHRDPEVYQTILELYPERILAAFIHKVNQTVAPERVAGLHLHESYAEVAAILYGYEIITRSEAKSVMLAAAQEGLVISETEMEALLDQYAP